MGTSEYYNMLFDSLFEKDYSDYSDYKNNSLNIDCNKILVKIDEIINNENTKIKGENYKKLFLSFIENIISLKEVLNKLQKEDNLKIILEQENKLFLNLLVFIKNDLNVLIKLGHFINYYQNRLVLLSNSYIELDNLSDKKKKNIYDTIYKIKDISIKEYNDILNAQYFDIDAEINVLNNEISQLNKNIDETSKLKIKTFDFDKLNGNLKINESDGLIKEIVEREKKHFNNNKIIRINNDKFNKDFIKKIFYDSLFIKYDSKTSTLSISSFCLSFSIIFYIVCLFLYSTLYDINYSILDLPVLFFKVFLFVSLIYSSGNFFIKFLFNNKKNKVYEKEN